VARLLVADGYAPSRDEADLPAQEAQARPRRRPRRLSRSADFERVYRQGRSFGGRYFVLHLFPRADGSELHESPRLGLSVSRKVGGAVERNKVKRLLRNAVDQMVDSFDPGVDVVVVARTGSGELCEREGLDGVKRELEELIAQSAKQGE
jgi:ribonuclease P protein component